MLEVQQCNLPETANGVYKYLIMYTHLVETYIDIDKHKHWIEFTTVVKLNNGKYVMFTDVDTCGSLRIYDTDWEFDINSIVEAEPYLTQVTIWKPKG